jgi:hypothetical protein
VRRMPRITPVVLIAAATLVVTSICRAGGLDSPDTADASVHPLYLPNERHPLTYQEAQIQRVQEEKELAPEDREKLIEKIKTSVQRDAQESQEPLERQGHAARYVLGAKSDSQL